MSDTTTQQGQYVFLPWVLTGIATQISEDDGENTAGLRPTTKVKLNVRINDQQSHPLEKGVSLYGPVDIIGVLRNTIIRTGPNANEANFDPNELAFVEFSQVDFPWRFIPAKYTPPAHRLSPTSTIEIPRVTPWLCLIVLRRDEFTRPIPSPDAKLPMIRVINNKQSLPHLDQIWAWAHCQVSTNKNTNNIEFNEKALATILAESPYKAISRIICPRKLTQNEKYYAFLVPTFKAGVQAGLGKPINDDGDDDGPITRLTLAWDNNKQMPYVELPFYYNWEFNTGENVDFEALARKTVNPKELPETVGLASLDVSKPFRSLDGIVTKPLVFGGVLWSDAAAKKYAQQEKINVQDPPPGEIANFISELKQLLDLPERMTWEFARNYAQNDNNSANNSTADPIITPPIYGKWYANSQIISRISADYQDPNWIRDLVNISPPSDLVKEWNLMFERIKKVRETPPPLWLEDLNLDPSNRVAAALGASVVQQLQEELMESAWDQAGALRQANNRLRAAQFEKTVSENIFDRTFDVNKDNSINDVHKKQRMDAHVMIQVLSPIQDKITVRDPRNNTNTNATISITELANQDPIIPAFFQPSFRKLTSRQSKLNKKLSFATNEHQAVGILEAFSDITRIRSLDPFNGETQPDSERNFLEQLLIQQLFVGREEDFRNGEAQVNRDLEKTIPGPGDLPVRIGEIRKENAQIMMNDVMIEETAKALSDKLNPGKVIVGRMKNQISIQGQEKLLHALNLEAENSSENVGLSYMQDSLDPIVVIPEFRRPMFEPLRDMSKNIFLPGYENIESNIVGLLFINNAFLNSYMVGLNHEMSKELLWREYTTYLKGTYFKLFWDSSLAVDSQGYADIEEILTWRNDLHLSSIGNRNGEDNNMTLLLIKGDLFRRFPGTVVYASKATVDAQSRIVLKEEEEIKQPVLRATMEPDMTFLGFEIKRDELEYDGPGKPGWFFIIQEQHFDPSFGFDEKTILRNENGDRDDDNGQFRRWDDLGRDYVGEFSEARNTHPGKYSDNYININDQTAKIITDPPDSTNGIEWARNSAHMAFITQQKPFRFAVYAKSMLPPDNNRP
jgi:hypothetical protein